MQTLKITLMSLILFAGMCALASGARVSQAEALRSIQAIQGVK